MSKNPNTTRHIEAWFRENPGVEASSSRLAENMNMTVHQVQRACWVLINQKGLAGMEALIRGHRWVYNPPAEGDVATVATEAEPKRDRKLYEELAVTNKGEILVQCEDGSIYKLVEL